jgi:cobalamin biosynthesis Mg chelatase CobN
MPWEDVQKMRDALENDLARLLESQRPAGSVAPQLGTVTVTIPQSRQSAEFSVRGYIGSANGTYASTPAQVEGAVAAGGATTSWMASTESTYASLRRAIDPADASPPFSLTDFRASPAVSGYGHAPNAGSEDSEGPDMMPVIAGSVVAVAAVVLVAAYVYSARRSKKRSGQAAVYYSMNGAVAPMSPAMQAESDEVELARLERAKIDPQEL